MAAALQILVPMFRSCLRWETFGRTQIHADQRDHVRRRLFVCMANRCSKGADSSGINSFEFVQALKGDETMPDGLAELEHDFDRIE
jgi:hypothetical protein